MFLPCPRHPQNITREMPSVVITLLAISSIEALVVLSVGMRSARNIFSAAANGAMLASKWTFQDGQTVSEETKTLNTTGPGVATFSISKPDGLPAGVREGRHSGGTASHPLPLKRAPSDEGARFSFVACDQL